MCLQTMMDYWIWCVFGLSVCVHVGIASPNRYYMEDQCGKTIDMEKTRSESIRIRLTKFQKYHNNMACVLQVNGLPAKRLAVTFIDNLIQSSENCQDDYIQIFDGGDVNADLIEGLPKRVCATVHTTGSYTTTGSNVAFRFKSDDSEASDGFHILITSFREDPEDKCYRDEFQCKTSGRCISNSLVCDDYEDCPDSSDTCGLSTAAIIGIAVGGTVFLLAIAGIITCYLCCKRMRKDSGSTKRLSSVTTASEEPVTPTTMSDDMHYESIKHLRPKSCIEPVYTIPTHTNPDGIQVETVEYYRPKSVPEPLYVTTAHPGESNTHRTSFVVQGPSNRSSVHKQETNGRHTWIAVPASPRN